MKNYKVISVCGFAIILLILSGFILGKEMGDKPIGNVSVYYPAGKLPVGAYQVKTVYTDGTAELKLLRGAHGGYIVKIMAEAIPMDFASNGVEFQVPAAGAFVQGKRNYF